MLSVRYPSWFSRRTFGNVQYSRYEVTLHNLRWSLVSFSFLFTSTQTTLLSSSLFLRHRFRSNARETVLDKEETLKPFQRILKMSQMICLMRCASGNQVQKEWKQILMILKRRHHLEGCWSYSHGRSMGSVLEYHLKYQGTKMG